jgi:hypothetical protein
VLLNVGDFISLSLNHSREDVKIHLHIFKLRDSHKQNEVSFCFGQLRRLGNFKLTLYLFSIYDNVTLSKLFAISQKSYQMIIVI